MWKFNSFRTRLLSSFLIFIGIILLIALQVYWIRSEETRLHRMEADFKKVNDLNLRLYKSEQEFFANELINPEFYLTGKSHYLLQHKKFMEENQQLIHEIMQNPESGRFNILSRVKSLLENLNEHNKVFNEIVVLQRTHGFKDFGVEGKMRHSIHRLENEYPEFDQTTMLTLRRVEKDYMLRKDFDYHLKLNSLYHRASITVFTPDATRQAQILSLLEEYYQNFTDMVKIEKQIGINNKEGLKLNLNHSFDRMEFLLNKVIDKAEANTSSRVQLLLMILQWSIICSVVLSIVVALVLSQVITKPFVQLSERMVASIKSSYQVPVEKNIQSSILEAKVLEETFIHMMEDIRTHLEEINQKKNKLEDNNQQLETINKLLSDTNAKLKTSEYFLTKSNNVKEKFLAIISHDVRGPLTTLKGFLGIMAEHPEMLSEEERQKAVVNLRNAVELQLNLLTNMVEWARSQMGDIKYIPETLSLHEVANNICDLFAQTAETKNISLINHTQEHFITADKNMLELILRNLFSNAIKFTHQGGKIEISSAAIDDKQIEIKVTDNGIGISKDVLKSVLNTYEHFTTQGTENEKGTGFGLLFCKEFVERNGGRMDIESEPNRGTVVTFTVKKFKQKKSGHGNITSSANTIRLS